MVKNGESCWTCRICLITRWWKLEANVVLHHPPG
jgi:hypothetical protein